MSSNFMNGTDQSSVSTKGNAVNPERKRRPVFVMGCHRSGTNLLYDTLLSAGGFAIYRGYLPIYETLIPHFGSIKNSHNRGKIVETWMKSEGFRRAGVDGGQISSELLAQCRNGGEFIRIVMSKIAESQGVSRFVVYDPDSVLHMARIRREIPNPLFIHIIRDGRDIALSLMKMEGFRPFLWSRQARTLLETALYWEWIVRQGRQHGRQVPDDYIEIHYEELVTQPRTVLAKLADFLDHDLDYDHIQSAGLGRLRESNSSFRGDEKEIKNPVNRWKEKLTHEQVVDIEALIGPSLEEFGYPLTVNAGERRMGIRLTFLSSIYPRFLSAKEWLKVHTPMGRLATLSALELRDADGDRPDHELPGS